MAKFGKKRQLIDPWDKFRKKKKIIPKNQNVCAHQMLVKENLKDLKILKIDN